MSGMRRYVRAGTLLALGAAWFVTLAGGWGDVRSAIFAAPIPQTAGAESDPAPQPPTGESLLRGRALEITTDLGMPTRLEIAGDRLLVIDRFGTESLLAFDRRSGRLLRSGGREGEGPGEFVSPVSLVVDGARLGVLDGGLNRVTWLAPEGDGFATLGTTGIALDATAIDVVLTPGGDMVVSPFSSDGRLMRLDEGGAVLGFEGRADVVDEDLPDVRRVDALQGTLRASPSRDRMVRTSRFASRIEIIDLGAGRSTIAWGPERFEPEANREARFGYLDAAVRADGFLALYSGRTRTEHPGRANYGSAVHAFDDHGRLRAEYWLDADVIAIAWSEADGLLYAVRHDPVPEIRVYELEARRGP